MTYQVLGFQTEDTKRGCDAESSADTLKDAKARAKYMLTEAYRVASEATSKLAVVEIWRDDTLLTYFTA